MIVIGPADSQLVLPGLLNLAGTVAALPVFPFSREEQVASAIPSQIGDRAINQQFGMGETLVVRTEATPPEAKRLMVQKR